jgi:XRE family transcriptional regulator, regulator of sulfur utilization
MTNTAKYLADNIRQLREERGLTQQGLSTASGIPRPTCASLESCASNPTLAVLTHIASALQVSIEELIGPPKAQVQFFKAGFSTSRKKNGGFIRALIPETIPGLEISRIELSPKGQIVGVPHTPGTREYLSCEAGNINLIVSGEQWELSEGDAIVFRGDQKHSYQNPHKQKKCVAMSVVCFAT